MDENESVDARLDCETWRVCHGKFVKKFVKKYDEAFWLKHNGDYTIEYLEGLDLSAIMYNGKCYLACERVGLNPRVLSGSSHSQSGGGVFDDPGDDPT